jgi:hypothetical protein
VLITAFAVGYRSEMSWDPALHPDEMNLRWSLLRAVEWGRWPIFLSQPLAPVLLLILSWKAVVLGTIVINLLWASFVRYRFVSVAGAYWGAILVRFKWLTCPAAAVYLFTRGEPGLAALSLLWPVLIFVMGAIPTTEVGRIQNMFMARLGYEQAT